MEGSPHSFLLLLLYALILYLQTKIQAHGSANLQQVSGARVLGFVRYTRRDRFVLAAALSVGLGDLLVPGIFTHLFDRGEQPVQRVIWFPQLHHHHFEYSMCVYSTCSLSICLPTYTVLMAGIVGVILNVILPLDSNDSEPILVSESDLEDQKEEDNTSSG